VIEAVAVLAPAVRGEGEGEGTDLDGGGQVELLGHGPAFLEADEGVGQKNAASREVEGVDARCQLQDRAP